MFAVIQEIKAKKAPKGEGKTIEVYETRYTVGGEPYCKYDYRYSDECFERPVKNSYRISICESYRENGKVKKRQTVARPLPETRASAGPAGPLSRLLIPTTM